jgi:hypothetical protein
LSALLGSVDPMRAIDLEAKIITAVDQLRAGQHVEHDLIECKRSWPQEQKARQLAGSLNRAGGDPVIYIIGIDEKTGKVHDVSDTDILDWWSQIVPQFDHTPPELVRHLNVQVGDGGEHVVAIAVSSDRAPYVVKTGKGNQNFEVPMREGTGTRSARRDELLRLLIPTVSVPPAVVLKAELYVEHNPAAAETRRTDGALISGQQEYVHVHGSLRIYFEHNGKDLVTLPAHGLRGRLLVDGSSFALRVSQARELTNFGGSTNLTMAAPRDGVTLTGPRAVSLDIEVPDLGVNDLFEFEIAQAVTYEVELDVLHAARTLRVDVQLRREEGDGMNDNLNPDYRRSIGRWSFGHPGLSK